MGDHSSIGNTLAKNSKMKKTYFLVTIVLVLAIGSFEVKTTPLENQWQRGSGNTYYLKGFLPMKRNEAQDWCVLMGGILAEPRSSEETSVIDEIIETQTHTDTYTDTHTDTRRHKHTQTHTHTPTPINPHTQ